MPHDPNGKRLLVLLVGLAALGGTAIWVSTRTTSDVAGSNTARRQATSHGARLQGLEAGDAAAGLPGEVDAPRGGSRMAALAPGNAEPAASAVVYAGRVVDALTDLPLEGALVALESNRDRSATALSNNNGEFTIDWAGPDPPACQVSRSGYATARFARLVAQEPTVVKLLPGGVIAGRLLIEDSAGLAAAEVLLWKRESRISGDPDRVVAAAGDGSFSIDGLTAGVFAMAARAPGYSLASVPGIVVRAGETTRIELRLSPGGMLRGKVVLRQGVTPVVGAAIELQPRRQGPSPDVQTLGLRRTQTLEDGSFELDGLSLGTNALEIRSPWGSRLAQDLEIVPAAALERTFELRAPASLVGVVLDGSAEPVSGALVSVCLDLDGRAYDWGSWPPRSELPDPPPLQTTVSDGLGAFEFESVPSGERLLVAAFPGPDQAAPPGFDRRLRLKEHEVRTGFELVIGAPCVLQGVILDPEGAPIAGAEVSCQVRTGKGYSPGPEASSSPDGSFELPGLAAGRVILTIESRGFLELRKSVPVIPDAVERVEFELEPGAVLAGRIVDGFGAAVPFGRALARPLTPGNRPKGAETDEYGRFRFDALPPGQWTIEPRALGWQAADPPLSLTLPTASEIELRLEPSLTVAGAVVEGEIALRGSGEAVPGLRLDGLRGGWVEVEGSRIRVTGARPGRLRLVARARGFETVFFDAVDLGPGAVVDLGRTETRRASRVRVEVKGPTGKPLDDATVRLERLSSKAGGWGRGPRRLELPSRGRGRYELDTVARYKWRLRVEHPKWKPHARVVRISKGRETLAVTLRP